MIIEHFKNRDPVPVYRRFRDRGRLAPESLQYVSSWVDEKLERCFQLMETENCTAPDYGPSRINTFLHHQGGTDDRVPARGLLRSCSGGWPALSLETRRREGPHYRVRGSGETLPPLL